MMKNKAVILPSILILLVLVVIGPSWGKDNPVWWPSALAEAQKDGYALITPVETQSLIASGNNFFIVDVRPDYEFKAGHLPGAQNFEIDLGDRLELKPQKTNAFKKILGPDKNRLIVIYCRSFR
jgi:phage shock protein E